MRGDRSGDYLASFPINIFNYQLRCGVINNSILGGGNG